MRASPKESGYGLARRTFQSVSPLLLLLGGPAGLILEKLQEALFVQIHHAYNYLLDSPWGNRLHRFILTK